MNRLINWIKGLFNRTMDKLEDPEMMLEQAKRDMQVTLQSNQEKAVQAITQKNMLENLLNDQKRKSQTLETQATMALKQDKRDMATQLMREKMNVDASIANVQTSYDQAVATVEQIKIGIKRQQEEVRKKTAEAMVLKTQWKQAQIQNSITKALDGLTFENQFEGFGAVTDKIREKQSEASARQEMQNESLAGKMMQLEDSSRDMEAESELEKLEQRLGLKPAATTVDATQTVSVTDATVAGATAAAPGASQGEAEKALEDLEKRLNSGN
ncbi:MAG: PspA/IM30 family protein [Armatimonadota bacterium]